MHSLFPTRTWLLAALLFVGRVEAQASPELRHVRWPLLDVVMVPDSAALWFMAAPNPSTTQWETGSHLVRLAIDPVIALQWVTVARKLVAVAAHPSRREPAHFTPPLPEREGPGMVVLGTNSQKPSAKTKFVLLASDSAEDIRWKSFASGAQVDSLLLALEATATASLEPSRAAVWNTLADRDPDTPVDVVSQPRPVFPPALASRGRAGRVWMSYIITSEGRADQESFFPLLSDEPRFTKAATEALLRGRYRPAVLDGQPIPLRVFQAILFRQK